MMLRSTDLYENDLVLEDLGLDYQVAPSQPGSRPVNRRSRAYIEWVQRSLNRVAGEKLAVDGDLGPRTRAAVRRFQQKKRLPAVGTVGPRTEAALITAGALPPPGGRTAPPARPGQRPTQRPPARPTPGRTPTLADLRNFSRRFVRQVIAQGREFDCADLAIELWIRFGEQYRLPVAFDIWDARNRRWIVARRTGVTVKATGARVRGFTSTADFIRYTQGNLGARGLIRNTVPVTGGHRASTAGDVYLWEYVNNRTKRKSSIGHTQIIDQVTRSPQGPAQDRIRIVQGSLNPKIIPQFKIYRPAFFVTPRPALIQREMHTGILVGREPRRFKGFTHLR